MHVQKSIIAILCCVSELAVFRHMYRHYSNRTAKNKIISNLASVGLDSENPISSAGLDLPLSLFSKKSTSHGEIGFFAPGGVSCSTKSP